VAGCEAQPGAATAPDRFVRTGDLAASGPDGPVLASVGLGSCVGLALLDDRAGVAGLAHVMLPYAGGRGRDTPGRFADTAVPALLDLVEQAGGSRSALVAVLAGGARMFAVSGLAGMHIGARNEVSLRAALGHARVPVAACATGGTAGRSVRVLSAEGIVVVRDARGEARALYGGAPLS
jgi:chemotaxis protein CheD